MSANKLVKKKLNNSDPTSSSSTMNIDDVVREKSESQKDVEELEIKETKKVILVEELKIKETKNVILDPNNKSRTMYIRKNLFVIQKRTLVQLLMKNKDVFTYSHDEMPEIDLAVIFHSLNVDENVKPTKQKPCRYNPERHEVTGPKLERLLKADFICEVLHTEWISNVVIVNKKNGK